MNNESFINELERQGFKPYISKSGFIGWSITNLCELARQVASWSIQANKDLFITI